MARHFHLASIFVGIGNTKTVKRFDKSAKAYIEVIQPEIVSLYNDGTGGVDLQDQLLAHFIDLTVVSSWIEYKKHEKQHGTTKKDTMDLLQFRIRLANSLAPPLTINESVAAHPILIARADYLPKSKSV